jgi:hypothetical protein
MRRPTLRTSCIVLALLLLAAVSGVCFILVQLAGGDGITQSKCNLIQPGMTVAEVNEIMGGPGSYVGRTESRLPFYELEWSGAKGTIGVELGVDGKVLRCEFAQKPATTWFGKFLEKLKDLTIP